MTGFRAFADPAGGTIGGDSFALGIAHADGDTVVLDLLFERPGPFSPPVVVAEICALLRTYGIDTVTGDRYSASWVKDCFAQHGVTYVASTRDRNAIYSEFLPLATSGRARLLDNAKLISQLSSLERVAGAGRDKIDHPRGARDDIANVACGALTLAAERPAVHEFSMPTVLSGPLHDAFAPNWAGSTFDLGQEGLDRDYFTGTSAWLREQRGNQ